VFLYVVLTPRSRIMYRKAIIVFIHRHNILEAIVMVLKASNVIEFKDMKQRLFSYGDVEFLCWDVYLQKFVSSVLIE
jgi:hypothetical protein